MTTGNKILFSVNDLRVTYQKAGGKKHEAVKGVSFDLRLGETLGIVGESGSGKSTIAKALMLLQESSGGKILFKGEDIALFSYPPRDKAHNGTDGKVYKKGKSVYLR